MKRVIRVVLSAVLWACIAVVVPGAASAQQGLERLVPDNPVFFKTSVEFEKVWSSVSQSNFWKQLTSLKLWDQTGVTAGLEDIAKGFSEEVGFPLSTENIMSLLGKEIAVAVYVVPGEARAEEKPLTEIPAPEKPPEGALPPPVSTPTEPAATEAVATETATTATTEATELESAELEKIETEPATTETAETEVAPVRVKAYFLFRGNPKSKADEIVGKFAEFVKKQAGDEAEFKESVHKGTKITTIKPVDAPVEFAYGFIDDVLAVGVGNAPPELEKIVDLAGGSGDSFAGNAQFKKILNATRMTTGRYTGCFYADMQGIGQLFGAMETEDVPMALQPMIQGIKQSFSVPVIMGGTGYVDQGLVIKMAAIPTGEVLDELTQLSLKTPSAAGKNIAYVPENSLVYVGVNSMPDPQEMWPLMQKQWEAQGAAPAMNMIFGQIETALGMKLEEDVIPWVGNEFGFVFTDLDTKAGFPYPKFAILTKIKDMAKAKAFLQKLGGIIKELTAETGFKFETSAYQGHSLNSVTIALPMPMPITLTPAYGIVDEFLVVGTSADLVRQMIDTSKGTQKDLAADAAFKSLNIPAKTSAVAFFNWARFMDALKATAAWAVQFTQAQPMVGESVKNAVDNYVVPIANCLSALQTVAGYQVNEANMSVATYFMRVKDLPPLAGPPAAK
ncbi:MAG: DUF3352 domain-containing protein [bacterium]|nr:DUF3352 domain-containing protein [bacterium]